LWPISTLSCLSLIAFINHAPSGFSCCFSMPSEWLAARFSQTKIMLISAGETPDMRAA